MAAPDYSWWKKTRLEFQGGASDGETLIAPPFAKAAYLVNEVTGEAYKRHAMIEQRAEGVMVYDMRLREKRRLEA